MTPLSDLDYAIAEEFFASKREPKLIRMGGRYFVVIEWLWNPSLHADEDDLPRED